MNARTWSLIGGIILCLVGCAMSLPGRIRIESRNRAYGLALEYHVLAEAGADLQELKDAGLNTIVLQEDSYGTIVDSGVVDDPQSQVNWKGLARVQNLNLFPNQKRSLGVGVDQSVLRRLKDLGFFVVVRINNAPRYDFTEIGSPGVIGFLPMGEQVLGFRSRLKELNESLVSQGLVYCAPEFAKISGDAQMVGLNPGNVVRLHAVQSAEIDKLTPTALQERFAKAFGERGMRILLLRELDAGAANPARALVDEVKLINRAIAKEHGTLGKPKPFEDFDPGALAFALIGAGIGLCLASLVWAINPLLSITGVLIPILCLSETGRLYCATLAAVLFPILAYQQLPNLAKRGQWVGYFGMAGISLLGGLCTAGLLNGIEFTVKADVFLGVKPAHMVPIVVAGIMLVLSNYDWRTISKQPVTYAAVLFGVFLLGILGFMLARTGNDNPGAVSGLELKFRSLLESIMVVRPRTKEFLIGHPALFVGLGLYIHYPRYRAWALLLLLVGSIGLTSIVNTLCHLHTPLMIGLTRIGIGLVLGLIVGLVIWIPLHRIGLTKREAA